MLQVGKRASSAGLAFAQQALRGFSSAPAPPGVGGAAAAAAPPPPPPPPPPPSNEMELFIDGKAITVPKNFSVLQACDAAGVDVPRFCYHHRLSIAGNCRMCLVEVEKGPPKPVASCAMPAGPGMKVFTDTPMVKKAREGVMEFLLINHPLDCPICDQGGECDLQDQAMIFGSDKSRFMESKRAVEDKNLGPLVKTVMNRCIHCTRCVRFTSEVAGTGEMGVTGRGRDSEIGTYVEKLVTSELSGNVIDLCPVGALTSKPFAFTARSWELKNTESIDVSDALGSNIRINSRGTEVMRILPRLNEAVNEEWLSDKGRFQYDGLRRQRLNVPLVKGPDGLKPANWADAMLAIKEGISKAQGNEIKAIAGKLTDAETLISAKDLLNRLGSGNIMHEDGSKDFSADIRSTYLANSTIMGLEEADVILLVGTNPRLESPVFNARLRKTWLDGAQVGLVGAPVDLTYAYDHLGTDAAALGKLASGDSPFFATLKAAKKPAVIVGPGVMKRADRDAIMKSIVKPDWNGFNVIHQSASRVAALDLGFQPSVSAQSAPPAKFVYLLGADDYEDAEVPADAFVVYQGHHGDKGAARADVVLPGAAYTEKAGLYANFEGRVQQTRAAVNTVGDAREDWKVVRALSEMLEVTLPYDSIKAVRARLAEVAPHFAVVGDLESTVWLNGEYMKGLAPSKPASSEPFSSPIDNFFMTDAISRASSTMAKCVLARAK
eukprot:gene30410-35415_t